MAFILLLASRLHAVSVTVCAGTMIVGFSRLPPFLHETVGLMLVNRESHDGCHSAE